MMDGKASCIVIKEGQVKPKSESYKLCKFFKRDFAN